MVVLLAYGRRGARAVAWSGGRRGADTRSEAHVRYLKSWVVGETREETGSHGDVRCFLWMKEH